MPYLDPFSFCAPQASAIAGLGGQDPASDPNYVFHTDYIEINQNIATFNVRIINARSSYGQITIRVHHHREGHDAGLVAGTQILLYNIDHRDLAASVRIRTVAGVRYALYGYYSEPSDLEADAVEVEYEVETNDEVVARERKTSPHGATARLSQAIKLLKQKDVPFAAPLSHPYSPDWSSKAKGPSPDDRQTWANTTIYDALAGMDMLDKGARGALIDANGAIAPSQLTASGCRVEIRSPASLQETPPRPAELDFIAGLSDQCHANSAEALEWVDALTDEVAYGGVVVAIFRLLTLGDPVADQNRVQQIALRLIGRGHDVAHLHFPRTSAWAKASDREIWFAMILRHASEKGGQ